MGFYTEQSSTLFSSFNIACAVMSNGTCIS